MKSRVQIRSEWIKERVAQAHAAAERGDGWIELGKLWGASNASALQWCQQRVAPDICNKIGMNGRKRREGHKARTYRKYEYINGGDQVGFRSVGEPRRYETCQHWSYQDHKLQQCGAPTKNGKPTCDDCKRIELEGPSGSRFHSIRNNGKWSHVA